MRLTFSIYVTVAREQGRSVYHCQPLSGPQIVARDPLLSNALSKLSNKMRKAAGDQIASGKAHFVSPWLHLPQMQSRVLKLNLVLRDRTLKWKMLLATLPAFDRYLAFSPSIPEVSFEVANLRELEDRASTVYSNWAQSKINGGLETALQSIGVEGDVWVEPIEVDVENFVEGKKKSKNILAAIFGTGKLNGSDELHKVGQCLDDRMADFDTVIGRDEIINEVDLMLRRNDRQGVLIVGQRAVGKTAIVRECARRRALQFRDARGSRPQTWWLSPQRLISGMSYLGQWEQRWLAILREATKRDHILYFDDLVGLFSAGKTRDSNLCAADVLRGYLSEHRVRILAESTPEELAILRRRDRALADCFHLVQVPNFATEDALPIVIQATQAIEVKQEIFFHPEAVPLIMRQQEILAPDKAFPGKAIDMVRTLGAHAKKVVDRNAVYGLTARQTGTSLALLLRGLGDQKAIEESLSKKIIGQPDAVSAMARVTLRYAQHLQPVDRPLGVLLFLGPTGVGKTESAKALAKLLYLDESHLVRIDMNELSSPYAAEQLVGSFDDPEGRLTSAVRRTPNCVILLDEIEKAHRDVFDYLLQVLGEGRLTDARGRVADFRSSIIIMTSNLGAREQSSGVGFEISAARRAQVFMKAAQNFFRPEFFNRIDEVVAFRSLDRNDVKQIVQIQLDHVLSRDGIKRRSIFVSIDEQAVEQVVDSGFDEQLGARAVRRMLERQIIQPVGDVLADTPATQPALIHVGIGNRESGELKCRTVPLELAKPRRYVPRDDLAAIVEAGKHLHQQLDSQLTNIADQLRAEDERLKLHNHNASYYSLREQVYRVAELLKAARYRLSRSDEPKLGNPGPAAVKRKSDPRKSVSSKRFLRDWIDEEDMRQTIAEQGSEQSYDRFSTVDLTAELLQSLIVAKAMIDAALTPRRWLVGMFSMTTDPVFDHHLKNSYNVNWDFGLLPAVHYGANAARLLVACLRDRFQYEVTESQASSGFSLVSGVSLSGLLGPLLGTYTIEMPQQAGHLRSLQAIEVPHEMGPQDFPALVNQALVALHSKVVGERTSTIDDAENVALIRGSIGADLVDYYSQSSIAFGAYEWLGAKNVLDKLQRWWLQCLPIPAELRSPVPAGCDPPAPRQIKVEAELFLLTN